MDTVRVISKDIIKAPKPYNQNIDLTPWDLSFLLLAPGKKGLLYHHPVEENHILRLRQTLSSVLVFFPPLAGRLEIIEYKDNTASCSIACNNAGVLFVHATTENTCVADILESTYVPPIVDLFFPFIGVRNHEGTSQPLVAVQVTELVDGIFIGFTFNHVVADGKSSGDFINSWAEISRGCCDQISKLPSFERWFPDDVQRPIRFPFSVESHKNESDKLNFSSLHDEKFNLSERLYHFTNEKIMELKFKANAMIGTNKISSLQALLTHLWCCVIRSKQLDPQEEVHCRVLIGARLRLLPLLPEDYFGNAGKVGGVTMKAGELLEEGALGKGAWEIHKMISSQSNEKFKDHYESWLRNPILPNPDGISNNSSLAIGSSPRFDFYGNDFGWGKPVGVRYGNKLNGMVSVFEGIEEGSIDLQVCLPHKILEAMGNTIIS
ncbi:unnamed protein product [Lathyrus sativus]|nr:unnamed protein product [Lathyrus sativus]